MKKSVANRQNPFSLLLISSNKKGFWLFATDMILHKTDGLCLGFTSFVSISWDSIPLETATSSYSGWRWSSGFGWSCWACCPWPTGTEIEETPLMHGSLFLGLGFVCERFESTRTQIKNKQVDGPFSKTCEIAPYVYLQSVAIVLNKMSLKNQIKWWWNK